MVNTNYIYIKKRALLLRKNKAQSDNWQTFYKNTSDTSCCSGSKEKGETNYHYSMEKYRKD